MPPRNVRLISDRLSEDGVNSIILGWVSSTCAQTTEKKAVSLSLATALASTAFVWTPYLWTEGPDGRYTVAMSTSGAFSLVCAVFAWIMRTDLVRANKMITARNDEARNLFAY